MIIRTNKTAGNYTPIHNHSLTDPRLSLRARGLLAYLLAKPDNWVTQTKNIQDWHQDAGRETILSALRELETTGYLKRRCTNNPLTGKLEWERVIYESPQGDSLIEMSIAIENIKAGKPALAKSKRKGKAPPQTGLPSTVQPSTVQPSTVQPSTVQPSTANPSLINTEVINTDSISTKAATNHRTTTEYSDDDDVSPPTPAFLVKENPACTRARVGTRGIRIALTDEAGNWQYNIDFIHAIADNEDDQRTLLRNACITALQAAEIHDDWDDLSSYLSNLNARQMQRLITWSYKLTQDTEWATRIDNWIGLIKSKIDTVPALRPWQKPKLAWFFYYCITGHYEPWANTQPQQAQLMEI